MKRRILLHITTLAMMMMPSLSFAKDVETDVITGFKSLYEQGIDEKLYIQTDKPYYSAGEQIWLKGYLRNAITHAPLTFTNFIYVELIDRNGALVSRIKIRRDDTGFNGAITLDNELKEGDYTIKAYTRWMLNKSDDFHFQKNIKIVSPLPPSSGEEVGANREERKENRIAKRSQGTEEDMTLDYDLQFFPEGGAMLAEIPQQIAFKALAEDGLSIEVKGIVYNSNDEVVNDIETIHKGMGSITFIPKEGDKYYAVVESAEGRSKRFDLPAVETEGAVLNVTRSSEKIFFQAKSTNPKLLKDAYIVIHSRGQVISINEQNPSIARYIYTDQLYDGVSVLSLIDAENRVISERLIFKKPIVNPSLSIKSDAKNYNKRTKAKIKLNVKDFEGNPTNGEFGVSVTDNLAVEFDKASDNILSYLLLSSDIKGHIEDPGLYFEKGDADEDFNLDLLMRTQGWRRFDIGEVINQSVEKPEILYEDVASFSGNVKGFFGNDARMPSLSVMCATVGFFEHFELDKSSTFKLVDLNIPDSTTYIVQAKGRKGGGALSLNIDPEIFATTRAGVFERIERDIVPIAFKNQSQDKFYYEGGANTINFESISVTTSTSSVGGGSLFSTSSTTREELESMGGLLLGNILMTYPNMSVTSEGVTYRDNSTMARFVVNDIDMEYIDVNLFTADDIEQIEFLFGPEALEYHDSEGGIFKIKMREGYVGPDTTPTNIAHVSQLGYQREAIFYQPAYDDPSLEGKLPPDYRTTIYWNGKLTPDEDGDIEFEFYTADKATTYTITVEGVTDSGEICQSSATIERTLSKF